MVYQLWIALWMVVADTACKVARLNASETEWPLSPAA